MGVGVDVGEGNDDGTYVQSWVLMAASVAT